MLTCLVLTQAALAQSYLNSDNKLDDPEKVAAILTESEQLKRSNPNNSLNLLKQLTPYKLSANQRALKTYLEAYHKTVSGNLKAGEEALVEFVNSQPPSEVKVKALASLISIFTIERHFTEAIPYLNEIVALRERLTTNEQQALIGYSLSHFYYFLGDYQSAFEYGQGVELAPLSHASQCSMGMINSLVLLQLNKLNHSYLTESMAACHKVGDGINLSNLQVAKLKLLLGEQQHEQAQNLVLEYQQDIEDTGFVQVIAGFYAIAAQIHWQSSQVEQAKAYADLVCKLDLSDYHVSKIVAYQILYQIEKLQGNSAKALAYFEHYHNADKAAIDLAKAQMLAFEQAKHGIEDKDFQLKNMSYLQGVSEEESKVKDKTMLQERLIMLIMAAVIIGMLTYIIRNAATRHGNQTKRSVDSLTELPTRRVFFDKLLEHHDQARLASQDLTLVVFDLDDFREINRRFGFQTGDRILAKVAATINDVLDNSYFVGRIGGDEFMIAMPQLSSIESSNQVEQWLKLINGIEFKALGSRFHITASFGIADAKKLKYNMSGLIAGAEKALMQSKGMGKNCYNICEVQPVSETAIAYT